LYGEERVDVKQGERGDMGVMDGGWVDLFGCECGLRLIVVIIVVVVCRAGCCFF
jgi:hypothetical protein